MLSTYIHTYEDKAIQNPKTEYNIRGTPKQCSSIALIHHLLVNTQSTEAQDNIMSQSCVMPLSSMADITLIRIPQLCVYIHTYILPLITKNCDINQIDNLKLL